MSLSADAGSGGDGGAGWRKGSGGGVCVRLCVGGEKGQEEVSNYLPPPLPLIPSPGFISPLHLQIKFVLRRGE